MANPELNVAGELLNAETTGLDWWNVVFLLLIFAVGIPLLPVIQHELEVFLQRPVIQVSASADAEDGPVVPAPKAAPATAERPEEALPRGPRTRALAGYLSKRFRVAYSVTEDWVSLAFNIGRQNNVDPLLVLAVMTVESSLNPIAESVAGAKGLMQVIPRFHFDKLPPENPEEAILEPRVNIRVGTLILKEYTARTGDVATALQRYAGAADDPAMGYSNKVLGERERLRGVLARHALDA